MNKIYALMSVLALSSNMLIAADQAAQNQLDEKYFEARQVVPAAKNITALNIKVKKLKDQLQGLPKATKRENLDHQIKNLENEIQINQCILDWAKNFHESNLAAINGNKDQHSKCQLKMWDIAKNYQELTKKVFPRPEWERYLEEEAKKEKQRRAAEQNKAAAK